VLRGCAAAAAAAGKAFETPETVTPAAHSRNVVRLVSAAAGGGGVLRQARRQHCLLLQHKAVVSSGLCAPLAAGRTAGSSLD
jgi:hypothetical protein